MKNLAKEGSYYWVITNFETIYENGKIVKHFSYRKASPKYAIETIIPIYKKLVSLEVEGGMQKSRDFLYKYLEDNNHSYDSFILEVLKVTQEELNEYFKG